MRLGTSDRWRSWFRLLTLFQAVATLAIPLVGAALKYEIPAGASGLWSDFIEFLQNFALSIILLSTFLLWSASLVKAYFGNPWVWDMVKLLLDDLRSDVFTGYSDLSAHLDRVTLFKWKARRWRYCICPQEGWLCTVERTGHMTRRKRVWFRAKNDGRKLEGVVGAVWGEGRTILKDGLPNLKSNAGVAEIVLYARETFVDAKYITAQLKKGSPLPRSLCGIMIEVDSKPWGVIVIDSVAEKLAPKDQIEKFFQKHAKVLGKLLAKL